MESECARVLAEVVELRGPVAAKMAFERLVSEYITWIRATPETWPKLPGLYAEFSEDYPGCTNFSLKLWGTHLLYVDTAPGRMSVGELAPAQKLLLEAQAPTPETSGCIVL